MRLPQLTFGKVLAGTAVVLVLTTGTAYAANTVGSADIINGSIQTQDIADNAITGAKIESNAVGSSEIDGNAVKSSDILNSTVLGADVKNNTLTGDDVADESLTAAELGPSSVGTAEIATDGVQASEIQDNAIDAGEIQDFTLTNQDVNVFSAEVNADGTLASGVPGMTVTSARVGAVGSGTYEVDFGRNVNGCVAIGGLGSSTTATALGEISVVDRGGNPEALFIVTRTSAGAGADRPFRVIVVC